MSNRPIVTHGRVGTFKCTLTATGSKKNTYYAAKGRMFPNHKALAVKKQIEAEVAVAMYAPENRGAWPLMPPYMFVLTVPLKHRTDLDNSCGHAWDALQKCGVITNDRDIHRAVLQRADVTEITIQVDTI